MGSATFHLKLLQAGVDLDRSPAQIIKAHLTLARNPKPETLTINSKPETLTINPKPETLTINPNNKPETLNPNNKP